MRQGRQKGAWEAAGREAWSCLHEDIKPLREERARYTGRPGALHKEPVREKERERKRERGLDTSAQARPRQLQATVGF